MIEIPTNLLPQDGRFGSGPSKVRKQTLENLQHSTLLGTSHRKTAFFDMVKDLFDGLRNQFNLPVDYEILIGNGGTTLFWDALAHSVIRKKSQHLSFGEFSDKFSIVTKNAPWLEDPVVLKSDYGFAPAAIADDEVDVYCLTHNETSTGVQTKVIRPDNISDDALVLVDATSAAGGVMFDPLESDIYYFAPQKCFGSEGGLFIAFCSPKAIARIEEIKASNRYIPSILDLSLARENSLNFTTYNTPSISTLLMFKDQVDYVNELGGLKWANDYTSHNSNLIYDWAENSDVMFPFVEKEFRSQVTCTINFDGLEADDVAKHLRSNGILDVESYRKIGQNQLRIATFPSIDTQDVESLINCVDYIIEKIK